ncbi:hypothetical protein Tco_1576929 [Tanacetum coccineum]
MVSLDYRLNPICTIKECSSCGALYNKSCGCSKGGFVDKFVRDPNKAPDSPPHPHTFSFNQRHCFYCKNVLGDGEFSQRCTCMRCGSGLSKGLCLIYASRYGNNPNPNSLNDSPNIFENVSQSPPLIDHHCCYGDGSSVTYDSTPNFVDDSPNVFTLPSQPPTYSFEFCGNDAHYGYDCPPQKIPIYYDDDDDEESSIPLRDIIISELPPCIVIMPVLLTEEPVDSLIIEDKHLDTIPATKSDEVIKSSVEDLVHTPSESDGISESECDLPVCDDSSPKKDEVLDDIISIPPGNGNDHFNAESSLIESVLNRDNVISSPKIDFLLEEFAGELALIAPIPPGIVEADFDPKGDIRFIENLMYDNSFPRPPETLKDDSETVIDSNNDYSSSDDDSPYSEDIDYVDALPPDPELVSLEVVGNVVQEDGEIDTDILLTIKDDILRENFLKVNLLIAKIEALKDNLSPFSDFVTKSPSTSSNFFLEETNTFDNSLPQFETFNFLDDHTKETSIGSTTTHADISLPEYDSFHLDSEHDSGDFTMDVVEDIFDNPTREPRVHVPNVLLTHPTLHLDSDFTLYSDSLRSDLVVSFPSETRNKIFDLGIFIGVQSKRFLSSDKFSISFIHDPPFPVIDTLLPFSSKNEDKVVNPGILAAGEEKSPHLLSHRGFKAFQLISESPMLIHGENIPILDVPFLHFYPP